MINSYELKKKKEEKIHLMFAYSRVKNEITL